jgi:predicted nucleic acid-binding protein
MELSRLSNPSGRIVADTSALINLNATQYAGDILRALPERVIVVDIVAGELEDGRKKGRQDADLLAELKKAGLVETDSLGEVGEALFEGLVVGTASATLDDGEAATIAYAVEHSLGVIVDDSKARRICKEKHKAVPMRCSVEIFQHPSVQKALGKERLSSAVLNALQTARMRVLPEHIEWVVSLIGSANANSCRSLPKRDRQSGSRT